ncbi:MAG: bifunctional precorrin-2 dehydrogenase/sirohydrochlorin ferrochelatase [Fusicatenibacter sp.]|nr:bifunctional precorrin-2 dehydrogenase/sirohydrochlorin ferrochelatase [Fusicatenibacter sp.]
MAGYFPIFVNIEETRILIVGGGTIALRRIRTLLPFAGKITVVAKRACEEIRILAGEGKLVLKECPFTREDLLGQEAVLACTDQREQNDEIYDLCKRSGIWVNNCSDRQKCDFFFPSVLEHDGVVIGINAGGENHKKVKETRMELEAYFNGKEEMNDGNDS